MSKASLHYPTTVVGTKHNGGYHPAGKRNYRKAVLTVQSCLQHYKEPRLYHLCFQGQTNLDHKKILQALAQKLKRRGIDHEWFSAREVDSEKGEHLHVFMLVNSAEVLAQGILNTFEDQFLGGECLKRGILLHINKPRNLELHGMNRYAALPYQGPGNRQTDLGSARLADALVWLTYIYKIRGKPTVDDRKVNGQIFSASRPNRSPRPTVVEAEEAYEDIEISRELLEKAHIAQQVGRLSALYL
jgi:hypothetical protein